MPGEVLGGSKSGKTGMSISYSRREMAIPRSRSDDIFCWTITLIVIVFFILAIVNICNGTALIASCLWVALVMMNVWIAYRKQGGLRKHLINFIGDRAGKRFVEFDWSDAPPQSLRFGFHLFGRWFIQKSILLSSIKKVEWNTGQATDMAGRNMNDWQVWIWFTQNEFATGKKQRSSWKSDLYKKSDLYGVGPSGCKAETEALGLSFVAFLRDAGADLIPDATTTCFVRRRAPEEME